MKLAILTCGMLPIPAVQGGAVENLIDFYLEYNDRHRLHDITIYSPWHPKVVGHPALSSTVNHYVYIDVTSLKAKIARKLYGYLHQNEYYNHFIEYYFERVYADLKKKDFDNVIIENGAGLSYKLAQRGYKHLILHMHNEVRKERAKYYEAVLGSYTKILTVSDFIKERTAAFFPANRMQTVYNGIDLSQFSQKAETTVCRRELGFAEDDFVMVYSGRINKEKGVSELIDAMLQLQDAPHVKLMILGSSFFHDATGEDDFTHQLKTKSEKVKDKIVFTGFIPYCEVPHYLHLADIAVLPSMWEEPFGLTIVEALAAGLPLITTRSGGIPEICEGIATIVDKENVVNNLATAILDLYQHPEKREQMAKASIERARLFDKETFARNFFEALENI